MSAGASVFELGAFPLQDGRVLPDARLVYKTYGRLAPDRGNVILYPTSYGAHHDDIDWLIRPDGILDPTRWFVVVPNMFGNGLSSSPSNLGDLGPGVCFTHLDNVRAQERLLREALGVTRLRLVYGWSMGAQQAYYWGVLHPARVERIAALCGTARTAEHNKVFLLSLKAALTADPSWDGQRFSASPERGYRAFARIYASWAVSQAFYRARVHLRQGYRDIEDYLLRGWEARYRRHDPMDLLSMLDTWIRCDVGECPGHGGDQAQALAAIEARTLVMPGTTDLYFTLEDCSAEAALIPRAELLPIPSIWGHRAGNPSQNPEDERFIRAAVHRLLDTD
jgi:homoserine O-acetyltransferase